MTRRRSYQKGNVEMHNGQWTVRYREYDHAARQWKWKREQLGEQKNKKAARKAAEPIMARVNARNNSSSPSAPHPDLTFKTFVEKRWRAYALAQGHRASTLDCHNSLIKNHLMPFFGGRVLAEITPSDISDFLEARRGALSHNSLTVLYALVRLMFEVARQYDLIPQSPVRPMVHRPEYRHVEKPTLKPEQIRAILAGLPGQERLYYLLLAVTGIRAGEGLALRWADFDSEACELAISHTLYRGELKEPKTASSRGRLRLHPLVAGMLSEHRRQSQFAAASDLIFCRPDGRHLDPSTVRARLYRAMDAAGISRAKGKHGFHIFRHTAGTLLFETLGDLGKVQKVLRHAAPSMTDRYVHAERPAAVGAELLAELILVDGEPNCDLTVTQESKMVS